MYARRAAVLLLTAATVVIAPTQAAAGGAGGSLSGDFTVDRRPDILARNASDGRLVVYPRTDGSGDATFASPVTINSGWSGMRWIGAGDVDGTGVPFLYQSDVISVDQSGVMRVAIHTGKFDGTRTLGPQVTVGTGWQTTDLIHPTGSYDDGSHRANLIARRKGTGNVYFYRNTGHIGPGLFAAPELLFTGRQNDLVEMVDFFTGDATPDLLFVDTSGRMGVFDPVTGQTHTLGTGWQTVDSVVLSKAPDGYDTLIARRRTDGALLSYRRTTHEWQPAPDGSATHIYAAPEAVGHNWHVNDIIT